MNADKILDIVARCHRIQSGILAERKPCSLDIDTQFFQSCMGRKPKSELYGISISFWWNKENIYCSISEDEEYEEADDALNKIYQIVSNL